MSEKIEDGGPAFPQPNQAHPGNSNPGDGPGMTLRDYFAAKAMQALINPIGEAFDRLTEVPEYAYQIADAMIRARKGE